MIWCVELDDGIEKELRKLGKSTQKKIINYLETRIATHEDPRRFGKALRGKLSGLWRYRVGDLRIICRIEDTKLIVLVITIGHRKEIYD
jgi:mRNA interferase RelE/StbE